MKWSARTEWSDSAGMITCRCSLLCSSPLRLLASSFKILPFLCRSSPLPHMRTNAGRMPGMAHSVVPSGLERNCGLTVLLQMGNTSHPLMAYRLLQKLHIARP